MVNYEVVDYTLKPVEGDDQVELVIHASDGSRWEWVTRDEPGLGDGGLLAASTVGGPGFSPAGDRVAVTRVGSTVFLAFSSGESGAAEIDGAAEEVRRVAQQFLDSL